ncbi:MAG: YihA family ribosome biogenesis GTP-binding protein [Aquificae bacterium]|nr:YihA family ribosome biogenesis GTP-binding protein [Aquificota bacterium]
MKVKFVGSFREEFPPPDYPEVVFVGRSNVGKSSLLNMVAGAKVARVSKTPGRTRAVNYFLLNDEVYLVDVPGYGFARVNKEELQKWKQMMERYFKERKENIKLAFLLVDSTTGFTHLDEQMADWFEYYGIPYVVVLTKSDKASQSELSRAVAQAKKRVGEGALLITSAKEGRGKKELLSRILSI